MSRFSQEGQQISLVLVFCHTYIPEGFLQLLTWFGFKENGAIMWLSVETEHKCGFAGGLG